MRRIEKRPYTMVEVLAVCVVIMILLGIGTGGYAYSRAKARESQTKALIARISTALETCKAKYGFYPPDDNDQLKSELFDNVSSGIKQKYFQDYAKAVELNSVSVKDGYVVDAYQRPLVYKCPGEVNRASFDLYSKGPDENDVNDDIK